MLYTSNELLVQSITSAETHIYNTSRENISVPKLLLHKTPVFPDPSLEYRDFVIPTPPQHRRHALNEPLVVRNHHNTSFIILQC